LHRHYCFTIINYVDKKPTNTAKKTLFIPTFHQIQFFDKLGGINETSSSQILKRMEMHDMSEAIDALQSGKKVIIR